MSCIKSFPCACSFHTAGEEQHKTALKEWALKKGNWCKANKDVDLANFDQENSCPHPPVQNWKAGTCAIKKICHFQSSIKLILLKTAEAILCILFELYCKHITVNTDNMKLVLGISAKIGSNYFSLIDVPDHPTPAAIICCLHAASALPTTTATTPSPPSPPITTSLPLSGTIRVSACQMAGIRAPVQFTKPVLEEQEKEKEKEEKREKENDNDDEDDDNND
ncbi:uncharacterized protein CIMG_13508 [Coccidioides immitis RS]|uniref:Uncharacterized protein n=1 Tax=Coccidioides immitis (strain RS) TaxID=246410 RepID=J3K0F4_COCIM|nr:uncharacterized protein CIMG_13508 [Coccidioides immitis RS]EAS27322.3 hypothetical protein CIMG_13508 [Coccidioides immitis RS]